MKTKFGTYMFIGALAIGMIGANHVFAEKATEGAPTPTEVDGEKEDFHHKRYKLNPEVLKKRAEEFGIETEGKDTEALAREVHEAKIIEKAKELGIKTEGKKIEDIAKEVRDAYILKKAKELGIKTDSKEIEDIS